MRDRRRRDGRKLNLTGVLGWFPEYENCTKLSSMAE